MIEQQKARKVVAVAGISFLLSLTLSFSGILDRFEWKAYDLFSSLFNPSGPQEEIVIVKVDQPSIDKASSELSIQWPWPRQVYAPLVKYLSEADAVFMDILFTEPSSYGAEDDRVFAEAVTKASNVYLPVFLTNNERALDEKDREFIRRISVKAAIMADISFRSAIPPIDPLLNAVRGSGNPAIEPDRDGIYRRVPLFFRMGEETIPNFVLPYLLNTGVMKIRDERAFIGTREVPLRDGRLLLRFFRTREPFESISAINVLQSSVESSAGAEPLISKDYFKGKKVFVGLTAAGLYDLKPTPVSSIATGVSIHATALENLMHRNFLLPLHPAFPVSFMLFICVLISSVVLRHHSVGVNIALFLGMLALTLSAPAALFASSLYLDIISPSAALFVSFIIATVYSYATEGKERRFVRRAFSQYMDQTLVDYVLKNPSVIRPGGRRRRVTVFFADIAGFTTIAEQLPAEETAKILHTILNAFTEVIIQHKGVIDKYIGDAIMAFWGAPLDTEQDEINACRAALRCMDSLDGINRTFVKDSLQPISMRIGIHSGDAIVGNLGSDRLFDYTAVGDTVNLASRLESVNKLFRTKIIISGETRAKTGNLFLMRELGKIEVKGKSLPAAIYELAAEMESAGEGQRALTDRFHQGLSLFHERRFTEAADIFHALAQEYPDDGPSRHYLSWCRELLAAPELTEGWDIIKMTVK